MKQVQVYGTLLFVLIMITSANFLSENDTDSDTCGAKKKDESLSDTPEMMKETEIQGQVETVLSTMNDITASLDNLKMRISNVSVLGITAADCYDLYREGRRKSGVYWVYPQYISTKVPVEVYCDMETEGGGWLVFQRRVDGLLNFNRRWDEYRLGFGDINSEFWLGNDNLHLLTTQKSYELRIELWDLENNQGTAVYKYFSVADAGDNFRLHVSNGGSHFTGNAGDSLFYSNGQYFSTRDRDLDSAPDVHCGAMYRAGWWMSGCHSGCLNCPYLYGKHDTYGDGINWFTWKGAHYSLAKTEMKIRPVLI